MQLLLAPGRALERKIASVGRGSLSREKDETLVGLLVSIDRTTQRIIKSNRLKEIEYHAASGTEDSTAQKGKIYGYLSRGFPCAVRRSRGCAESQVLARSGAEKSHCPIRERLEARATTSQEKNRNPQRCRAYLERKKKIPA